ncbi:GDP-mannose 4,6-dehydratase [Psychromicrobium sp. YIM B11713]|uniref:GDP-mannose 4,6-dehydratase n=1 Tax=Psychromicrobium sp. YIM B11713 TaxID=3145233 RepID=UPI00374E9ED6
MTAENLQKAPERTALITGATGQDGSYLAETLLDQGWAVHGLVRPSEGSLPNDENQVPGLIGHAGDLADIRRLESLFAELQPDVVFNLGGISSVHQSWQQPYQTTVVSGSSAVALLECAWRLQENSGKQVRFFQASSAEIFGHAAVVPQNESVLIRPVSPYGAAKALAHHAVDIYRNRGLFAASAILYNHESVRRPVTFVTRKITSGVAAIARGQQQKLRLGNLDAIRDWGWAPDFVEAIQQIASAKEPADFVVATGVSHSVRDFVAQAFSAAGIDDWEPFVEIDPAFSRPSDAPEMRGDITKITSTLGWRPRLGFEQIVETMVRHDLQLLDEESTFTSEA